MKSSWGYKIPGQVKGPALIPGVQAMPHQDTRALGRHNSSSGIGSGGFGRVLWVVLGCPKESAGHSLSMQAVVASSGGSSSH